MELKWSTSRATWVLSLLLAIVLVANYIAAQDYEAPKPQEVASGRAGYKLPKLFDFDHYKKLFGKTYGSLAEELSRKRLFIARAFTAFVTGVKYKFRRMSHYLGVNHMSDWSDEEHEQMRNKAMEAADRKSRNGQANREDKKTTDMPEFIPAANENAEGELVKLIDEHKSEPGFVELAREMREVNNRLKRSIDAELEHPRDFSLDDLIASPDPISTDQSPKLVRNVASNNPEYEPIELVSFGVRNGEKTKWVKVKKEDPRPLRQQARSYLSSWLKSSEPVAASTSKPEVNRMFVDLRQTKCLFMPRNQRKCGSCYAFAATTIMEFHYCMKTGKLVQLSEQYMIDCGPDHWWRLNGCDGGTSGGVTEFILNFGLETSKNYPYTAEKGTCPYEKDVDVKTTGYIRMPIKHVAQVHVSKWAEVLPHGPLYVEVATGKDFRHYGGGVYDGKGCAFLRNHAMVLVGHGREDGQEFWLIRNSHGLTWGALGHWKLAKSATKKCIPTLKGHAFGTTDGINYDVQPEVAASG